MNAHRDAQNITISSRNMLERTLHRGIMGDQNAQVRADLVYFPTSNSGAVFSTGSIAWVCALSHNNYDNSISRLADNVLKRFLKDSAL